MKSVEDINLQKSVRNENNDDEEKEKKNKIPKSNSKVATDDGSETRRVLPNPSLIHGRKSKDIDEWLDEMKFYAWKSRGIPESRRKELWLTLAEKYFRSKCINWQERRKNSMYVEDRDMEDQIIKDLHRTGSAFCSGPNSIINQGKLKHLLLEYAQWNPKVGYCQGFNVLGAFILQIMEKEQENSLKIMVYLLEGILPTGYYSESLVGLQIDMAVFRQLMFEQLPKLAAHLQNLENGQGFDEPPLTNLFTMQWFLTIFCTCLSMPSLLRVWDLIFLEGNEVIFRTSLAIWSIMERYVTKMNSIDDFYGNMGILFQRLCSGSMCDPAELIRIVSRFKPILNLHVLRAKHKQYAERTKRSNKSNNHRSSIASSSSQQQSSKNSNKHSENTNQKLLIRSDSNKKVNIKNIDMSVFKKQYEKLKRRPSLELNTVVLRKKSLDGKSNFSVNKFWSNTNNNNSNNNNNNNNNINTNSNINNSNKKFKNSNEIIINNKQHKKLDNNLIGHHRHIIKSKKSPDIKQFPIIINNKSDKKLDSKIKIIKNNKDDINNIHSSDSSSTTSLCDNDDNDDDSLYECRSLNQYYSDNCNNEKCDNWPNLDELKNNSKDDDKDDTSENVNLILEQIASYSSTINNTNNDIIIKSSNNIANNIDSEIPDGDENISKKSLELLNNVTKLPDTENIICDENTYNNKLDDENIIANDNEGLELINKNEYDFNEIEKWREKYLKESDVAVDNSSNDCEVLECENLNNKENENSSILLDDYQNSSLNENILDKYTKLNDFNTTPSSQSTHLVEQKSDDLIQTSTSYTSSSSHILDDTIKSDISNIKSTDSINSSTNKEESQQQDNPNIIEEGVTNELFDNLFQNKFSQFAKYAVKDYLEGIHYTKNYYEKENGGETKKETKTYYDVFKIIEENSKVLDSLSKKSNIIISPGDSSDNIQQSDTISDKSDEFTSKLTTITTTAATSPNKDDDLNDSLSDVKTLKENQIDLTPADEISSSECNSSSLKTDVTVEISDKFNSSSNIEFKIDTIIDDDCDEYEINLLKNNQKDDNQEIKLNNDDHNYDNNMLLSDKNNYQRNRLSRSFEDKIEENEFLSCKDVGIKVTSKSLEDLEKKYGEIIFIDSDDKEEKEDNEKYIRENIEIKNVEKDRTEIFNIIENGNLVNQRENLNAYDLHKNNENKLKTLDNKPSNDTLDKKNSLSLKILTDENEASVNKDNQFEHKAIDNLETKYQQLNKDSNNKKDIPKYENADITKLKEKEYDDNYDQYWFIEKPDQIEKRRNSLRKAISPIETIKNSSLFDSSSSNISNYNYDKTEDILSKIRLTNLDDLECKKSSSILTSSRPSSLVATTDKILYPSTTKTVRIQEESPKANKYDEYKKESHFMNDGDDNHDNHENNDNDYYGNKNISNKLGTTGNDILNRYGIKINKDDNNENDSKISKSNYDSCMYDRKYSSCNDESDFKERLESIKNTIKFIDDLCDGNDKIIRNKKKSNRDLNLRKSLIFDELLSKSPSINTTPYNSDDRYNKTTAINSSEKCSNKYNSYDENNDTYINPISTLKRNSSVENLNNLNEKQQIDNLMNSYSSSLYKVKTTNDDTTKENIDFESIEKRKSKSYSNIYFSKIE